MSGIYIHVPFCKQACSYCDFYFTTRQDLIAAYTNALCNEISAYTGSVSEAISTIYFGGGTPSRLQPAQLSQIFNTLNKRFDLSAVTEITLETNPDDVSSSYLYEIKALGINRLSLGVQSFNTDRLRFMHRAHSADEAHACLKHLADADFPTFTVDLIYGNPGQTIDELASDIRNLLMYTPPHISAYALTIEPATRLGKAFALGRLEPAPDDLVAAHMDLLLDSLHTAGLHRYEVSNFARPGHEALHNSAYWNHTPYMGFGPAAHSFDGQSRWKNRPDIARYIASNGVGLQTEYELLSATALAEEYLMMQLRTRNGLVPLELERRYGYSLNESQHRFIHELSEKGLIYKAALSLGSTHPVRLTPSGMKIADTITVELISRA